MDHHLHQESTQLQFVNGKKAENSPKFPEKSLSNMM